MTIYQETFQLAQLAQINNFQECTYNTDKYWPHCQWFFIRPENHRFRASSSRWLARNIFGRRLDVGYHSWQRKFWDFRLVKMVIFDIVICTDPPLTNQNPATVSVPPGTKKLNRSTWRRLQTQIISKCFTCLIITFMLIS